MRKWRTDRHSCFLAFLCILVSVVNSEKLSSSVWLPQKVFKILKLSGGLVNFTTTTRNFAVLVVRGL